MSEPIKPRTILAIADAYAALTPDQAEQLRELSPVLATNLRRLLGAVRSGAVEIATDDPYREIEAERRATYLDHPLSRSHVVPRGRR